MATVASILSCAIFVVLSVSTTTVESGRFPLSAAKSSAKAGLLVDDDDQYKSDSLEGYFNGGDDTPEEPGYITDVQIDELQNAQDKMTQDQEAYVVDPRCPRFDGACDAPPCNSDADCENKICCFNGCIQTCLNDTSPPIAVDWVQDTEFVKASAFGTSNTVTIPGGCKISRDEKTSLDLFLKYRHVTKCVCLKEDVLCYVRKRYPWSSSSGNSIDDDFDQSDDDESRNES